MVRRPSVGIAAVAALICCLPSAASGAVPRGLDPAAQGKAVAGSFYVAPDGDDAGAGTQEQPWRTIQHAADMLLAGQTAYVRAGTYPERVQLPRSGSQGASITIAAAPGESPVIDGSSVDLPAGQAGLLEIRGRSYVRVIGLTVAHARGDPNSNGILVAGSDHVLLQDNRTNGTQSSGIGIWRSRQVTVRGNQIVQACQGGQQESLTVAGTTGFLLEGNEVRDTAVDPGKEGIDVKDGSAHGVVRGNRVIDIPAVGIYVDAWDKATSDIQITGNTVSAAGNGIALASEMGGLLTGVRIANNLVSGSTWIGISVSGNGDDPSVRHHPMSGITIINNTLWANGFRGTPDGGAAWGGGISVDNPDARKVIIRNNTLSKNNSFQLSVPARLLGAAVRADHNLIDGFRGATWDNEVVGTAAVRGDPRFVSVATGDVRLRAGSPAIDAGSLLLAPREDFSGVRRPVGRGIDIGAYEYAPGRERPS